MINFDALTLKAFIAENINFLSGATIKKIQQASRRELILHLRNNGENKKLYININPEFFHICFCEDLQKRGIKIPDEAPMFCMLLRKYLQNGKIKRIVQPHGERIIEFHFEYKDVLEEVQTLCLATELMGKYSNIILYDYDTKIIVGCAHNVGEEKSKYRELAGTIPYIYPQKQNKEDILNTDFETFQKKHDDNLDETSLAFELSSDYYYLTNPLIKQILKTINKDFNDKDFLKILFKKIQETVSLTNVDYSINEDYSEYSIVPKLNNNSKKTINEMIDDYFEYNQIKKILKQKKAKIYTHIDTQIKKADKQINNFKEKLSDSEKAEKYRLKGDILMMNTKEKVSPKIKLINPYNNEPLEIELDERYTIVQNANRYYKLYKKTKSAIDYANSQIKEIEELKSMYEEQKFYTDIASSIEETEEIGFELGIKTEIIKKNKKQNTKQINLETYEFEDFKVYLGKNSIQNDYLLSKIASPDDLWFHPLNMHGAHVILKRNNKKIPDDVLLSCAKLAKRFSKAQNNAKIPIIYTERKYVKKANSKIAFVTYKNEKEIYC